MFDEPLAVHFKDGHTLTGFGDAFDERDTEIQVRDGSGEGSVTVYLHQVKVVCFVQDLYSTGVIRNRETPPILHTPAGRRAEVVFRDGEKLNGTVALNEPPTHGFFVTPLNRNANSLKIYVNPAEVVSFRFVT